MAHLLLNGVTSTGAGSSIILSEPVKDHTVACYYVDANNSVTAVVVDLEGTDAPRSVSDSDAVWYQLDSHTFSAAEITAKSAMWHVVNKPIQRVRLNLKTFTGAGSGDVLYGRYIPVY